MARVVVLQALDRSQFIASQVDDSSSVYELKEKFASSSELLASDLLLRQTDGTLVHDEQTAADLCSADQRGMILTVEHKVPIHLCLLPEPKDTESTETFKSNLSPPADEKIDTVLVRNGKSETESYENGEAFDSEQNEEATSFSPSDNSYMYVKKISSTEKAKTMAWLSMPVEQLVISAHDLFALDPRRHLCLFFNGQEVKMEQSLESQGIKEGLEVEIKRHVRDIASQMCPSTTETASMAIPATQETEVQCHRVPSMKPQSVVVDCLFPEKGWRSVDETILPVESMRELIPRAAAQLEISSDEANFVFQMGITFPLSKSNGSATQVMRGSSRKYIDDQGRDIAEVDRTSQTLTPLLPDDLPSAPPVGKPVVNIWRNTAFLELTAQNGKLSPLPEGLLALSDKSYCGFFRGLRISGPAAGSDGFSNTTERTFVRVTALLYVDAATGQPYEDEEAVVRSTEAAIRPDVRRTEFFVVMVAEGRPLPKFRLPKNRYLALFTRFGEEVELGSRGELIRRSATSSSRMWTLPREMSQLLRDITRYFLS